MVNQKLGTDLKGPDLVPTYQGDLALAEDKDNLKAAILRRLNTPLGGLFAHPEYGNPVFDLLSANMDAAWEGKAVAGARQCLEQEPRIKVVSVKADLFPEERLAVFTIAYTVLDEPGVENLVWQVNTP